MHRTTLNWTQRIRREKYPTYGDPRTTSFQICIRFSLRSAIFRILHIYNLSIDSPVKILKCHIFLKFLADSKTFRTWCSDCLIYHKVWLGWEENCSSGVAFLGSHFINENKKKSQKYEWLTNGRQTMDDERLLHDSRSADEVKYS